MHDAIFFVFWRREIGWPLAEGSNVSKLTAENGAVKLKGLAAITIEIQVGIDVHVILLLGFLDLTRLAAPTGTGTAAFLSKTGRSKTGRSKVSRASDGQTGITRRRGGW